MVKTFSLNENNDIFIGEDGNLSISDGKNAVLFICENVAQTRLNEMIYDQGQGLPYLEAVFVGATNIPRFKSELTKELINVDGVLKVLNVELGREGKDTLTYEATILTEEGQEQLLGAATV